MLQGWLVHLWLLAWVSASDWSCHVGNLIQPIRSTTQIWVVTHHQYGISVFVSQTSFGGETSGSIAKCRFVFSGYYKASTWPFDLQVLLVAF